MRAEAVPEREEAPKEDEDVEVYDRSMSPDLLEFKKLPYEDRQIKVIQENEDIRSLVSTLLLKDHFKEQFLTMFSARTKAVCCCFTICAKTYCGFIRTRRSNTDATSRNGC